MPSRKVKSSSEHLLPEVVYGAQLAPGCTSMHDDLHHIYQRAPGIKKVGVYKLVEVLDVVTEVTEHSHSVRLVDLGT